MNCAGWFFSAGHGLEPLFSVYFHYVVFNKWWWFICVYLFKHWPHTATFLLVRLIWWNDSLFIKNDIFYSNTKHGFYQIQIVLCTIFKIHRKSWHIKNSDLSLLLVKGPNVYWTLFRYIRDSRIEDRMLRTKFIFNFRTDECFLNGNFTIFIVPHSVLST